MTVGKGLEVGEAGCDGSWVGKAVCVGVSVLVGSATLTASGLELSCGGMTRLTTIKPTIRIPRINNHRVIFCCWVLFIAVLDSSVAARPPRSSPVGW